MLDLITPLPSRMVFYDYDDAAGSIWIRPPPMWGTILRCQVVSPG